MNRGEILVVIKTIQAHRFVDGIVIPEGEVLSVIKEGDGQEILTVEYDGVQKMVRRKYVIILD